MKSKILTNQISTSKNDVLSIFSVLQNYLDAGKNGDSSQMAESFHKNATIHGYYEGVLLAGSIQALYDWVNANPPASGLKGKIQKIDLEKTIATARIEIDNWFGTRFTDQFTLFKENEKWLITSKVFHSH